MNRRVNVGIKYDVYNRLKGKGRFGESFSELVSRLIDEANSAVRGTTGGDFVE